METHLHGAYATRSWILYVDTGGYVEGYKVNRGVDDWNCLETDSRMSLISQQRPPKIGQYRLTSQLEFVDVNDNLHIIPKGEIMTITTQPDPIQTGPQAGQLPIGRFSLGKALDNYDTERRDLKIFRMAGLTSVIGGRRKTRRHKRGRKHHTTKRRH